MTFLHQIQLLLERTYAPTGVNLEDCLIGFRRCEELSKLAGSTAYDLGSAGRTFLRIHNGRLFLAIYYHPRVINALETHHPFKELSQDNIQPLIIFLEELNHALHAALLFLEKRLEFSEELFCDLELQAKVDTYLTLELLVMLLRDRKELSLQQKRWLRRCLFKEGNLLHTNRVLKCRYDDSIRLGHKVALHLDGLNARKRIHFIRRFRSLTFSEKKAWIQSLIS